MIDIFILSEVMCRHIAQPYLALKERLHDSYKRRSYFLDMSTLIYKTCHQWTNWLEDKTNLIQLFQIHNQSSLFIVRQQGIGVSTTNKHLRNTVSRCVRKGLPVSQSTVVLFCFHLPWSAGRFCSGPHICLRKPLESWRTAEGHCSPPHWKDIAYITETFLREFISSAPL